MFLVMELKLSWKWIASWKSRAHTLVFYVYNILAISIKPLYVNKSYWIELYDILSKKEEISRTLSLSAQTE